MFKDISKHSLVFVVIRKHDKVCDEPYRHNHQNPILP